MKASRIIVLVFFLSGGIVSAQNTTQNSNFISCQINFLPSLTLQDIQAFTQSLGERCDAFFEVDAVLQLEDFNFSKLAYSVPSYQLRPSIQNVFSQPSFQLGDYDNFEGSYRFTNPAFYEATKGTVMSFGNQTFVPSTGGIGF